MALIAGQEELLVPTSDGTVRRYVRYAWAEFDLQGNRQRLLLLKDRDSRVSNRLFLAFRDRTSGKETYGGGRYSKISPSTSTWPTTPTACSTIPTAAPSPQRKTSWKYRSRRERRWYVEIANGSLHHWLSRKLEAKGIFFQLITMVAIPCCTKRVRMTLETI